MAAQHVSRPSRLVPLAIAIILMCTYALLAFFVRQPTFVNLTPLENGELTAAQLQAIDVVKELNTYLVSTTTLLLGGLGWYLSQYQPPKSKIVHTAFFASVAFLILAYAYAGLTNVELTDELAQNSLALQPRTSLVLHYLEMQIWTCGIASILMVAVFADAVTKGKL
ncbi:MAG TPA: hypothetical protein VKB50_30565 [Vicinamibacterales bacterium]|nr:hypothetical protein [Vicinamibacterales bacterium]